MAYTKAQIIDAFCEIMQYNTFKLDKETKLQFISRKQNEWVLSIAKKMFHRLSQAESELIINDNIKDVVL